MKTFHLSTVLLALLALPQFALAQPSIDVEAERILDTAVSTAYTHRVYIDESKGIYDLDCSAFASYVLSRSVPDAFRELTKEAPNPNRPLAKDFVSFFGNQKSGSSSDLWLQIEDVEALRPGDLIAWKIPEGSVSKDTGHVMIVDAVPTPDPNSRSEWFVPVLDSAVSGHGSLDPRRANGPNGVGRGIIGLILGDKGKPIAFRWSGGESAQVKFTEIRMGRVQ